MTTSTSARAAAEAVEASSAARIAFKRSAARADLPRVMVIDGNDDRGINVGVLARPVSHRIPSHVNDTDTDTDTEGEVFSRNCPEYPIDLPGGEHLGVLVIHFKSKLGAQRGEHAAALAGGAGRRDARPAPVRRRPPRRPRRGPQQAPDRAPLRPLLKDITWRAPPQSPALHRRRPAGHLPIQQRRATRSFTCSCRRPCSTGSPAAACGASACGAAKTATCSRAYDPSPRLCTLPPT